MKISLSKLDYLVSTRYNQCEQCPRQLLKLHFDIGIAALFSCAATDQTRHTQRYTLIRDMHMTEHSTWDSWAVDPSVIP
jgi:hypothetical protein|eukprot:COSAG06_NODE_1889_length_8134_cov_3.277785_1_plen_79_part_00